MQLACLERAKMYGPAALYKTDFRERLTWELHQCIRPLQWSIELRANMGIRAHPRLTNGKTSLGHLGTQSHGCAGQTVRPSLHSISQALAGEAVDPMLLGLPSDVRRQRDHV